MTLELSPAVKQILRSIPDRIEQHQAAIKLLQHLSGADPSDTATIVQIQQHAKALLKTTSRGDRHKLPGRD